MPAEAAEPSAAAEAAAAAEPAADAEPASDAAPATPFVLERYGKILDGKFDELDLADSAVSDEDVKLLCDQIWETASTSTLRRLVLQRCNLGLQALEQIGRAIGGGMMGRATPLEALVLSGNDFGPTGLNGIFLEGLKDGPNLRSLDLSCCCLTDEGIVSLCEILALRRPKVREVPALEELRLGCNHLGPTGAATLSKCLATNLKLRSLDITANVLGEEGARILADGLRANKGRLKKLNASQNELKRAGAKVLAEFFVQTEFRFTVHLIRPRGTTTGMTWNQEMVVTNMSLNSIIDAWNQEHWSEVVFAGDKIVKVNEEEGGEAMLDKIREEEELDITFLRSGGLQSLDLCHNMVPLSGVKELRKELGMPNTGMPRGWQLSWGGGERELWLSAH